MPVISWIVTTSGKYFKVKLDKNKLAKSKEAQSKSSKYFSCFCRFSHSLIKTMLAITNKGNSQNGKGEG